MAAIQQGEGKNGRGIPAVTFIPDVAKFLEKYETGVECLYENLTILLSKYRRMMKEFNDQKLRFMVNIPEIERTLKTVQALIKKAEAEEDMTASFPLADGVYVEAKVPANNAGTVYLWLGASVMLE